MWVVGMWGERTATEEIQLKKDYQETRRVNRRVDYDIDMSEKGNIPHRLPEIIYKVCLDRKSVV